MIRTYPLDLISLASPLQRGLSVIAIYARRVLSPPTENHIVTEPAFIRVASIPAAHPYVRAITDTRRVRVLPDPAVPGAPADVWWPPVALTSQWLASHGADFDVLHVHFGLESFSPGELREALETAHRVGRPIVYTVHDLENPQLCLLYTSPSPRDLSTSRMPSSA